VYNALLFFSKNIQEKNIRILNQNNNIVHFEYNDYHYAYSTTDSLITKVYKVNLSKFGIEYAEYNIKILPTVNSNSTLDTLINFIKHNYTFISEDELKNTPLITKKSVGEKFPPFAATSIQGINYNNNSLLGKVVVIDFFYQSCLPCVKLIPELNELVKEVDTGKMIVLGVDHRLDDTLNMKAFINRYNIQYPIICGIDGELLYSFSKNTLFPHTVVLNKEGEIAYFSEGYTKGIFKKLKEAVLKELEK
jgi:thiol-disulfide isomerase/thioredoxin